MTKDEVVARLREMAGTPKELAVALGVEASDASFRRALQELVEEGVLVAEGTTRNRSYRNRVTHPTIEDQVLALVPCSAREFSDRAHKLGVEGLVLGRMKVALGIETFRADDGRWHCRHVKGYTGPTTTARQDAGLTTKSGSTDSVAVAPIAARANAASKSGTIGGKGKEKAS